MEVEPVHVRTGSSPLPLLQPSEGRQLSQQPHKLPEVLLQEQDTVQPLWFCAGVGGGMQSQCSHAKPRAIPAGSSPWSYCFFAVQQMGARDSHVLGEPCQLLPACILQNLPPEARMCWEQDSFPLP